MRGLLTLAGMGALLWWGLFGGGLLALAAGAALLWAALAL